MVVKDHSLKRYSNTTSDNPDEREREGELVGGDGRIDGQKGRSSL